jgi:hypothetical protein
MIPLPVITALIAAVLAFAGAWTVQGWRYDAQGKARLELAQEVQRMRARVADKASEAHEVDRVKIETEFVVVTSEVEKIVEKTIYRNVCFDADGLRAHARAVRLTGNSSEPPDPVPAPAAP